MGLAEGIGEHSFQHDRPCAHEEDSLLRFCRRGGCPRQIANGVGLQMELDMTLLQDSEERKVLQGWTRRDTSTN